MKKLLLFSFAVASFSVQAQNFWTEKATGFDVAERGINDISIVDQNIIWVKAYDGTGATGTGNLKEISRSLDGGETWMPQVVDLGSGTALLGLGSLSAVSATTAWVSAYPDTGNTGGVWKTVNGGEDWTKQESAAYTADSFPNIVHFWDENNGVTMGDPLGGYFEIYTTSDGGTTWTRVSQANIPPFMIEGSTTEFGYAGNLEVAGNTIWFGTDFGRLYRSTDMGATWTVSQTPLEDFSGENGGSYSFSNETKGILNSFAGGLWNTMDGGETWTEMSPTGTYGFNDIEYVPGTSTILSSGLDANMLGSYYSLDDGMNWMVAESDTQFTDIEFLDSTTGFAGGFNFSSTIGGIYKYTGNVLAVAQFNNETMTVAPNPSNGNVQISGITVKQVTVYDISGKQVYNNLFNGLNILDLDLTSLNSGMYL
nr:T9SS type A sorting domain-containing protein [Flavisolibacter sp.]